MKKNTFIRPVLNGALISSLLLLSGCGEWFKGKVCPTCPADSATAAADSGEVLLSLDGQPVITKGKFDNFYEAWLASQQNGAFAALQEDSPERAFRDESMMELVKAYIKKNKKDQDPKYKQNLERAQDIALWGVNSEVMVEEILKSIDVTDEGLQKFYDENKGKHPALDNPAFLKTPEGIKIVGVEFNDEKSAKDFLTKAQKAGSDIRALAKAIKKDAKDFGIVSPTSRMVDFQIRLKARGLQPDAADTVTLQSGKWMVIKGVGPRQAAVFADFADVIKDAEKKEGLTNLKKQVQLQAEFMKRIEDMKKELNAVENTKFFEEAKAKKKAELEAKLKEIQEAQAKEAGAPAAAAAAPAEANKEATKSL